jgi:hypothetical protein
LIDVIADTADHIDSFALTPRTSIVEQIERSRGGNARVGGGPINVCIRQNGGDCSADKNPSSPVVRSAAKADAPKKGGPINVCIRQDDPACKIGGYSSPIVRAVNAPIKNSPWGACPDGECLGDKRSEADMKEARRGTRTSSPTVKEDMTAVKRGQTTQASWSKFPWNG